MKENVTVVILAERLIDRTNTKTSKLFHKICGKTTAAYAVDAAKAVSDERPVIIADEEAEALEEAFGDSVFYAQRYGAELLPQAVLNKDGYVLILPADMPLVSANTLKKMIATADGKDLGACVVMNEDENAQSSSVYLFDTRTLRKALRESCSNFGECVRYFADKGHGAEAMCSDECYVVNDLSQMAKAAAKLRQRKNDELMDSGVTLIDPNSIYIDTDVLVGADTVIYPGVTIEGKSEIGRDCVLYPGSRIADSIIGNGTKVQNSVMTQAQVGDNTTIGPYAYLRPKAVIGNGCKVGDFVEVKNAVMKDGAKASHLAYIGDGEVGENSNIGCGVIFCNYDGKKKSRTVVGKNAFVGSNVNLVAPVKVGDGAFIAAGTTVTQDVEKDALCIGRSRQKIIEGWAKKWWGK